MKNIKHLLAAAVTASIASFANAAVVIPGRVCFCFDFKRSGPADSGFPSVNNGSEGWAKYRSEIPTQSPAGGSRQADRNSELGFNTSHFTFAFSVQNITNTNNAKGIISDHGRNNSETIPSVFAMWAGTPDMQIKAANGYIGAIFANVLGTSRKSIVLGDVHAAHVTGAPIINHDTNTAGLYQAAEEVLQDNVGVAISAIAPEQTMNESLAADTRFRGLARENKIYGDPDNIFKYQTALDRHDVEELADISSPALLTYALLAGVAGVAGLGLALVARRRKQR